MTYDLAGKDSIKIIVKPNSAKNELIGFNEARKSYIVRIKAKAEKGRANSEIIKFFSKLLKKEVKIVKGITSKEKILKFM